MRALRRRSRAATLAIFACTSSQAARKASASSQMRRAHSCVRSCKGLSTSLSPALLLTWGSCLLFRRKVNIQRRLSPQEVRLLLIHPIAALISDLHIKVPHHTGKNQAELRVCETVTHHHPAFFFLPIISRLDLLHADTVTWTIRERIEAVPAVISEFPVLPIVQPAFREKFLRALKVAFAVLHGTHGYG